MQHITTAQRKGTKQDRRPTKTERKGKQIMRENIETMASRGLKAIEKDGLKNDINVKEITKLRNEF